MVKKRVDVQPVSSGTKIFLYILIAAIIIFVFQGIFIFGNFFESSRGIIANLFLTCFSLLAFVSSILIYKRISVNFIREKRAKLFLIISLFLFFLGDLSWLVSELFFGNLVPLGSVPDFIWLSAYVFLIISLVYFISMSFRPSSKMTYWVIILGIILGGFLLYLDVEEDLEEGSFTFAHAIQDAYILFDMVAVLMVIYLVWPIFSAGKRFYLNWLMLVFGIATRVVYDQIFANMSQQGTYYTGHPIDMLYVLFYIFVIASFYFKSKLLVLEE